MDYRQLAMYQNARGVVKSCYAMVKTWPNFWQVQDISRQLIRAATSVGANMAEGHGRHMGQEYIHYLFIAQGSANEVDHWLNTALDLEIGKPETLRQLIRQNNETRKMLVTAIDTLQKKQAAKTLHEPPALYTSISSREIDDSSDFLASPIPSNDLDDSQVIQNTPIPSMDIEDSIAFFDSPIPFSEIDDSLDSQDSPIP